LYGSGLGEVASISLETLEAPILSKEETAIAYQIPFEAPLQRLELRLNPNPSPFEGAPQLVALEAVDTQFIYYGTDVPALPGVTYGAAAIHDDFGSVVSDSNPARPGEVLHFYMTGLGAVDPPVGTGSPAPTDVIVRAQEAPVCRWWEAGTESPLEVLFAGLAPGLTGIYQVSMRMPANPQPFETNPFRGHVLIQCGEGSNGNAGVPIAFDSQ
jgi:uncharacterized protein (TIGR03437 family)